MGGDRDPETICAIATPPGRGGIGVVRVSGAGGAVDAIARAVAGSDLAPRTATFVTFRGGHGEPIDQGLALRFPAPASYTGDTVVEFHGHGSPAALRLVVARCLALGARL
ncbi:MAG TPA: tRNA uridine-5-carboxymethylaminomethyl(34) synthesis GTPase MnmE, partial [Casimicrobiaceae bacterium]|nr:tRNA uridine-5-carboxymethylaminomethyl(34) synthesis GTPase MnmE [Casimicrobiaceae bacterium]